MKPLLTYIEENAMEIVSVFAILISPIVAVWVSMRIQSNKDARQDKISIFSTLMATRNDRLLQEHFRALNMIDFVFHDKRNVRNIWHEYCDMLHNRSYEDENGVVLRDRKFRELMDAMAKTLGYDIDASDIERTYIPQGFTDKKAEENHLQNELLRVLTSSESFGTQRKESLDAVNQSNPFAIQ
ncbi:MAG: DUF6680 family protein [Armatimonadota bacterium]